MDVFANQLGINITEEKLQLVEIAYKENIFVLENVEEEFFEEALTFETKETKFIHILQNAYNEITLRNSINTDKVSISLPLNFFKVFELPLDQNLKDNDLTEYIEWEFSQLFPALVKDDFSFQPYIIDKKESPSISKAIVYAISKPVLKVLHKFSVRNNLQLMSVDNAHLAATSFLQISNNSENQLSIFLDSRKVSIALLNGRQLLHYKQKEYKGILDIPKTVKHLYDEIVSRDLVSSAINNFFVSGNTVSQELINSLEMELNLTAKSITPFNQISVPQNFTNDKYLNGNSTKFSSAAGMAIRLVS